MSWGYKIMILYCTFAAGIFFMAAKSSSQQMDLVTTDYYAKELKYQDKIDEIKRTNALSEEVKYLLTSNKIEITLPKEFANKEVTGTINLYCPSNAKKDITHNIKGGSSLYLPITAATKGMYELQLQWQCNGLNYYYKTKIFI